MMGEFFREAAVLVAVLGPMDILIMDGTLTLYEGVTILGTVAVCGGLGFWMGLEE